MCAVAAALKNMDTLSACRPPCNMAMLRGCMTAEVCREWRRSWRLIAGRHAAFRGSCAAAAPHAAVPHIYKLRRHHIRLLWLYHWHCRRPDGAPLLLTVPATCLLVSWVLHFWWCSTCRCGCLALRPPCTPTHHPCPNSASQVVEEYTRLKPINPLARFLPALRAVAMRGDSFGGLDGFEAEVKKLANDQGAHARGGGQAGWQAGCPATAVAAALGCGPNSLPLPHQPPRPLAPTEFIKAQWTVCDAEYHEPAMKWCQKVNCRLAITKAQLHDALVNVSWTPAGWGRVGQGWVGGWVGGDYHLQQCCSSHLIQLLARPPCSMARGWARSFRWITSSRLPKRPRAATPPPVWTSRPG